MKKLFLPLLTILILFSCKKEIEDTGSDVDEFLSFTRVTEKADINQAAVVPEALTYYKNIAEMAKWYSKHPEARQQSHLKSTSSDGDSVNTVLAKLEEITIADSANVQKGFFELDDVKMDSFLSAFVVIQASQLSEKLKFDTTNQIVAAIAETNLAYSKSFSGLKSASESVEDPYWRVRKHLNYNDKPLSQVQPHLKSENSDFWATVVANNILGYVCLGAAPIYLSPQTFVDRIRGSIVKGRILIALPGGTCTNTPIVFYPNKSWFDVGHVAVLTKNASEIPNSIDNNFQMSISTNSTDNLHVEPIHDDWCEHHGLSFVGQVYDVSWQWYYKNWRNFGYRQVTSDVNNDAIYRQVTGLRIGTPYCNI